MSRMMTATYTGPEIRIDSYVLQEVCRATLHNAGSTVTFRGAAYDSRLVKPGCLFVALRGERTDGHLYLAQACAAGAAAVMVQRDHPRSVAIDPQIVTIEVNDTLDALGALASWHRNRFEIPFVGVTGSNGKTTTKELIAAVLAVRYNVFKTPGNLNSRIGLPASLFDLASTATAAVCEMGMSTRGEIDALGAIVKPRYAVFTNIAPVHLETLGSIEEVAAAKFELLRHVTDDGLVFFCVDDPLLAAEARTMGRRARTYGIAHEADLRASDIRVEPDGTRFRLDSGEDVFLPLFGRHNVYNALAAISIARQMKVDTLAAVAALAVFDPASHRSQIQQVGLVTLIDDTYNANPQAMEAALLALAEFPASRRRVVVLGDMLELGQKSDLFHSQIGKRVAEQSLDLLVTVGPLAKGITEAARSDGLPDAHAMHFDDSEACAAMVAAWSRPGDTILLKGSRGVALERVVEALTRHYQIKREET